MPVDVRAVAEPVARWLDRHAVLVLVVLTMWVATLLGVYARAKPLWHDEVYTILGARLPVVTLWRASLDGFDLSPPLNTVLTRGVHALTGEGLIATRAPAMVGLSAALVLLFVTVRRRTNSAAALVAALVPLVTPAFVYGFEARGYGLTLGLFAAALYGWSEAAAGRRRASHLALMAVALAAGVWAHYFAVLAFVPIVAGEVVRQATDRRFAPGPWVALAASAIAILPLCPLMAVAAAQRGTFWTRVAAPDVGDTYAFLLGDLATHRVVIVALLLAVGADVARRVVTRRAPRRLAAHDLTACAGCLALPAAGVLLGHAAGAFTERYLVFTTVGLAFALPQLLWALTTDDGLGELTAVASLTLAVLMFSGRAVLQPPTWRHPMEYHPVLAAVLASNRGPVAMTGGVAFLGLWYSLPEDDRRRVVYLADPAAEIDMSGTDTVDRGYLALARWTAVPVARAADFASRGEPFLLYSFGPGWAERTLLSSRTLVVRRARSSRAGAVLYDFAPAAVTSGSSAGPAHGDSREFGGERLRHLWSNPRALRPASCAVSLPRAAGRDPS